MANVYIPETGETIAVHSIFCIGRNYAEHAKELNNPVPTEPIIFTKPPSSVIHSGEKIVLPPQSKAVHHEVETVVLIGKTGKNIPESDAMNFIKAYGIGIDVTARDVQSRAKEKGHPWAVAKGFDTFAPLSDFVPASNIADAADISLHLSVNDEHRQTGNSKDMLFPIPRLIAYLSNIFTLNPGDLIFTGTPEGVGLLNEGDELVAVLGDNLATLRVSVVR
ncbi:MAG: fumarylacetoacetate hydrolase family protein [Calditrichia bacterium]